MRSIFSLDVAYFSSFDLLGQRALKYGIVLICVFSFFSVGADVIYDPLCLPHLVRVLRTLLNQMKSHPDKPNDNSQGAEQEDDGDNGDRFDALLRRTEGIIASTLEPRKGPFGHSQH